MPFGFNSNAIEILLTARDDASRVIDRTAGSLGGLQGVIARLGGAAGILGGLGAAAVGAGAAILSMGKQMADQVEQLDRLSSRTGVSIERLQVMRQIIEEGGGNVESLTTALSFLNRAIANQDPLLAKLGITTRDAFEAFMQLGEAFAASDDTARKNLIAMRLLGRGGADLIADVEAIPGAFAKMNDAVRETRGIITEEMAPTLRELDQEMDKLGRTTSGWFTQIKVAAAGAALEIVKVANAVIEAAKNVPKGPGSAGFLGAFGMAGAGAGVDAAGIAAGEENLRRNRPPPLGGPPGPPSGLDRMLAGAQSDILPRVMTDFPIERWVKAAKEIAFAADKLVEVPELRMDALQAVLGHWSQIVDEITSTASVLDSTLNAVWNGIESGFSRVFLGLTNKAQTFKGAMSTIFSAIRDEILRQLAAIVASYLFKIFLRLVSFVFGGGLPVAGGAGANAFSGGAGSVAGFSSRPSAGSRSATRSGGDTFNIYALDSFTTLQAVQSGAIRRANDTLAFRGRY